jgi:hypothetical protein
MPALTSRHAALALFAVMAFDVLAGCGGNAPTPAPVSPDAPKPAVWTLTMRKLDEGSSSGVTERRTVAIRTAEEWAAFYKGHKPGDTPIAVDFSKEMVLAVLPGEKPSGGYAVSIVGVQEESNGITAKFKETAPDPNGMVSMGLTQPYALVAVPRSDKRVDFLAADGTR